MGGRLFIAIGVSKARGLPVLPGVWRSVRDLVGWAKDAGYETVEITDEGAPVDVARVKAEIEAALAPGLSRIVLYFVGHGYSVPPEQYLILSAGPAVPDQRIARDGLRDMLATYGPSQISVITDACQVLAPLRGLAVSVLDPDVGEVPRQTFDGFYAAQPDAQAFAFRATETDPELCLFSWVLHRALTFGDEAACDAYEAGRGRRVVTSYSLGDYLDVAVPSAAAARNAWQQPQTNTGFRPPNHVYSEAVAEAAEAEAGAPGDEAEADEAAPGVAPPRVTRRRTTDAAPMVAPPRQGRRAGPPLEERVRSEWRRPFTQWAFEKARKTGARLILDVPGGGRPEVRLADGDRAPLIELESFRGQGHRDAFALRDVAWPAGPGGEPAARSQTVLLRFGLLYALVPLHRDLWAVAQAEKGRGPIAIGWGSLDAPPPRDEVSALEVLKGLLLGRLSAADAPALAAIMRTGKHRDPLKGIVSAYLYDSVGDVANIRRMAWYYRQNGQDVPFDIALLTRRPLELRDGRLEVEVPAVAASDAGEGPEYAFAATPACRVAVAGRAPLLRAGWSKLADAPGWGPDLAALADHLTDNPIATFRGKAVRGALLDLIATG